MFFLTNLKKVMISLPNNLLKEIDGFIKEDNQDRSQFISDAMEVYVKELRVNKFKDEMRQGYLEMSKLNLGIATESFMVENNTFFNYEARLAECD
ncbi:CopG family ribbon-helix-helix protein [Orenia marismortui]|uniref:CopG family ribbon-helix-helix protein n=1 Tax=Orenia marismortui TaxID=46469 RepID=UPI001FBAC119|nr:CopG family transcriptional regulator [Orenia marismortui]